MRGINGTADALIAVLAVAALFTSVSCGGSDESPGSAEQMVSTSAVAMNTSLANQQYRVDSAPAPGGRLFGTVRFEGDLPADSLLQPTHDVSICKPMIHAPYIGGNDGVGDALVWLSGVTTGAADTSSRRVSLTMNKCRLEPRVQRAAVGATLLIGSRDAMNARLRFLSADDTTLLDSTGTSIESVPRGLVPLADAGVVVPLSSVLAEPGLVEVRDDHHPWVRGWIAVAPHPYVAVSNANGEFSFDGVPSGVYVLVTWHERLGRLEMPVIVDAGVETRVVVRFRDR